MKKQISIIGLGWLGEPLGISLAQNGYDVKGTTTSDEKLMRLSRHPFYVGKIRLEEAGIIGDWETIIEGSNTLVLNFPPGKRKEAYGTIMQHICDQTPADKQVIFVSSTSVYGNENKEVTEESETNPQRRSGIEVHAAEEILRNYFGDNLTVVRMAGLIGPKRHPGRFLAGRKSLKNPSVPVNLIHQQDAVKLLQLVIEKECYGEVFNGCSDQHPERRSFYENAAKALNLPLPSFDEDEEQKWKTVSNRKSKELLGIEYEFSNPEKIFEADKMPVISIVGAGPGATSLLTVHAINALKEAEMLLHDNLVSEEIMSIAAGAERVYVGRKYGDKSNQDERQHKINLLMEENYKQGKKVVRLKSGDPYIFGRAAEEARYLSDKGLPFEVVPGISASLAAANRFSLPVTERRKSSSLLICTAHTADYTFDQLKGIAELLKDGNSLAIYMGLKSLDKLIPKLINVTNDPSIPISAVSNVSRTNEKLLASSLSEIRNDLKNSPLEMPVVFIVGVEPIEKK
ncbi:MAG: uroporphyrinogen-III C-methyltransferase [Crocinitomicaceae bacterium]|nr:uroporphyrinogen-III C-methyltransferase [Crocinitomicaceae bacterium]